MQVSIVNYTELESAALRLDPEYYSPKYLKEHKLISKNGFSNLKKLIKKINVGFVGAMVKHYRNDGVTLLQTQNINAFFISDNETIKIDFQFHNELKKSKIHEKNILIARSGSFGKASIYLEKEIINSSDIIIVEVNESLINPYFLVSYLNSKFGVNQMIRLASGGLQGHINLTILAEIEVPKVNIIFQNKIEQLLKLSYYQKQQSTALYTQAQAILLSDLGLTNWQPKHQLTFIKNHSDTEHVKRTDAEYFQPKYEAIIKAIKAYKGGWGTLGDLVTVKKSVEVGSGEYLDEGIPFVRVSNLSPFEITEEKYISEKLYSDIKQHQPKQGEILFSKDATPGIAHYLDAPPRKMIPSGGILRLKSKTSKINNEYLTLVLNSVLVKEQINRDVGGSIILHWRPDQVKETVIPILAEKKQTEIQTKVIESLRLRKQSKHLLECAKRAVEIAIEQDEQAAIDWLKNQIED